MIVIFMSVPDITDDKVIRARYKIGGLGNNDSLDFSFPTHIDLGWAAGRKKRGADSIPWMPFVLARNHPNPQTVVLAEIQQREERVVIPDFESIEQLPLSIGGYRQRPGLIRYLNLRFGDHLLPRILKRHPDRSAQPTLPCTLDRDRLLVPRIVDADLRPNHFVANNASTVAHDRLPCDFARIVA